MGWPGFPEGQPGLDEGGNETLLPALRILTLDERRIRMVASKTVTLTMGGVLSIPKPTLACNCR